MVRFWWIKREILGWDVLASNEITCYIVSLLLTVWSSHTLALYLKTQWHQLYPLLYLAFSPLLNQGSESGIHRNIYIFLKAQ